jgi:hypothetical protein
MPVVSAEPLGELGAAVTQGPQSAARAAARAAAREAAREAPHVALPKKAKLPEFPVVVVVGAREVEWACQLWELAPQALVCSRQLIRRQMLG